ncbi:MAG TPA: amino acid ABC transporter permease [Candidatus Accumulibacter phosphatis]|nr:MAG: Inner membrane amino-acid ABC transporter permease protein YhdY [Candidatus Accumulibacter sp. SK-11]HAY26848.1 amino acid ABC transporter permease [Accumulibacter sp.]HRL78232.1 amino acid ABC transporter permease [Candidatus Accumulibacter phosphatis]HCN67316.1 amino acid ABC transporter permease [Accumulibacter sp.]HCV13454.1 amino acid ABC transporter permease [Accumulibacter sp.]
MNRQPALAHRPLLQRGGEWLRANLFSSVANGVTTLLLLGLLVWLGDRLLTWAVLNAVWGNASVATCNALLGQGACWAVVADKWRQMLFGIYPQAEQWRPAAAVLIFCGMLVLTAMRRFWHLRRLLVLWLGGSLLCAWLMAGGGGLTPVPTALWGGLPITLMLAVFGTLLAFPLGVLLALGRRSSLPIIRAVSISYIELVRGVPLITVLFMASIMFALFLPEGISFDKLLRAQVAIILFNAAYIAEVVRAGLQALPRGQHEAAAALGLGYWQTQLLVILPQALRITIPAQVNSFIDNFKDTSLVIIVSIFDFLYAVRQAVISDLDWRHYFVEGYLFAMAVYWLFCYAMSHYSQWLEKHLARDHRT